jgi:hypothetical protein
LIMLRRPPLPFPQHFMPVVDYWVWVFLPYK